MQTIDNDYLQSVFQALWRSHIVVLIYVGKNLGVIYFIFVYVLLKSRALACKVMLKYVLKTSLVKQNKIGNINISMFIVFHCCTLLPF